MGEVYRPTSFNPNMPICPKCGRRLRPVNQRLKLRYDHLGADLLLRVCPAPCGAEVAYLKFDDDRKNVDFMVRSGKPGELW